MPDVLLIQPPIRDFYLTRQRTVPYGLACIAGALLEAGFSTEILDALASTKARELAWPAEMAHLAPHYGRPDRSPFALFHRYQHFGCSFGTLGRPPATRAPGWSASPRSFRPTAARRWPRPRRSAPPTRAAGSCSADTIPAPFPSRCCAARRSTS